MGAREHVRQDDVKALQCISPTLLKSLAFAVHRKNLASERILGALQGADNGFLKEVWSFDGAFQVHSVEFGQVLFLPGQDCKRALFIVQGDCTYMQA